MKGLIPIIFFSIASLDSVNEVLDILCNLPPDFQPEIDSSLNKLRLLLVKLMAHQESESANPDSSFSNARNVGSYYYIVFKSEAFL